jgi:predicted HTH transcriptional regulator
MPDLAAWHQWVVNVSRHNCEPAVSVAIEHVEAEGRDVLAVHVPHGQDKPYRANGRVYVRVDREVHEATREEVSRLLYESGASRTSGCRWPTRNLEKRTSTSVPTYW